MKVLSLREKRSQPLAQKYLSMMDYECANPSCRFGFNVLVHHIFSLRKGGADEFWNMLAVCPKCHGIAAKQYLETQFVWKSMQELAKLGFILDNRTDAFRATLSEDAPLKTKPFKRRLFIEPDVSNPSQIDLSPQDITQGVETISLESGFIGAGTNERAIKKIRNYRARKTKRTKRWKNRDWTYEFSKATGRYKRVWVYESK